MFGPVRSNWNSILPKRKRNQQRCESNIQIKCFTDNKSLIDLLHSSRTREEKNMALGWNHYQVHDGKGKNQCYESWIKKPTRWPFDKSIVRIFAWSLEAEIVNSWLIDKYMGNRRKTVSADYLPWYGVVYSLYQEIASIFNELFFQLLFHSIENVGNDLIVTRQS